MRYVAVLLALAFLILALPAHADLNQVAAREVARNNNCTPKSVDVYQASVGSEGATIYKVSCDVPKAADPNAPKPADTLMIRCDENLCQVLHPVMPENK
jgi:cytochrome c5